MCMCVSLIILCGILSQCRLNVASICCRALFSVGFVSFRYCCLECFVGG